MKILMSEDLSYAAALIDGEGCITVNSSALPIITVGMTAPAAVTWMHENFGGSLKTYKTKSGWKPCHVWSITGHKAVQVVAQLRPYLKIKYPQADIVAMWPDFAPGPKKGRYCPWDSSKKTFLIESMRELNRRGSS